MSWNGNTADLDAIKAKWLTICGACDTGIGECTHPADDYRPVMLALVELLERIRDDVVVMLDGKGGWYGVPGSGREAAAAKFTLPLDLAPETGPPCGAVHPPTTYGCVRRRNHIDPWHVASNGRYLTARWSR